MCQTRSRTK